MNFTKSYTKVGGGDKVDREAVTVTEEVELDGRAQRRIIAKLLQGEFTAMSERGIWNEVKSIGTVTKYEERGTSYTTTEERK